MNPLKKVIIDELLERVNASPYVIVVDYNGMTVPQFSDLRNSLTEAGAECHVAKNTYMRAALAEAGAPDLSEHLNGQTAFVTGSDEIFGAAKAIKTFAKKNKIGDFKTGVLDGEILTIDELNAYADLPSREALLSSLLGTINGAASAIARVIAAKYEVEGGSDAEAPAEA